MPLVRITLQRGKPRPYRHALANGIYEALRETFAVPEEDRFLIVNEMDADDYIFSRSYAGIARDDDLVVVEITVSNTRTVAQKKALMKSIVVHLSADPGLRPENVFINLVEVAKENWSFGNGIAQYADT